jgi:syntaxin-binding protein 5
MYRHSRSVSNFLLRLRWNKKINIIINICSIGAVKHISVNPSDNSKILIGFDAGLICLWDLSAKKGEQRFFHNQMLKSICWQMEGKQFVCSYANGSLVTWSMRPPAQAVDGRTVTKPTSIVFPHGKTNKETGLMEPCEAIEKVIWRLDRSNYTDYYVFSGGLPVDVTGVPPSITFMKGKSTTLLELEHCVLDFLLVTDTPYSSDYQDPKAIIAMLTNDVVAIDCKSPGYPCFKNPYAMDFNESAVTCCHYVVDCPADLICALYKVGTMYMNKDAQKGFSAGPWPVDGGRDGSETCAYSEMLITGHADGSIRFWDASSTCMQSLYRIKTAKFFEKVKKPDSMSGGSGGSGAQEEDPYSITNITLCTESRYLAVAGASSYVIYFKFQKKEKATETKFMEIPIVYEVSNLAHGLEKKAPETTGLSPSMTSKQHFEFPPRPLLHVASQSSAYTEPCDAFNFDRPPMYEYFTPLRLRPGAQKKLPGYHAELVCLTPWVNGDPPLSVKCLTLNANYGLMAYGNGSGLVIVDIVQNVCLLNMGTADLYGSIDPFQRMPKSPKPLDGNSPSDIIQKVDLSNYCQVATTPAASVTNSSNAANSASDKKNGDEAERDKLLVQQNKDLSRVKSPDCRRLQKTGSSADDSSFSKSQSSSINSLDMLISSEGVSCVEFADSFATKNDFTLTACTIVGTTLGSVVMIMVNLPDRGDPRLTEPVVVSPSGTLFRIRGMVLSMALFDCSLSTLSIRDDEPLENVKVTSRPPSSAYPMNSAPSSTASSTTLGNDGGSSTAAANNSAHQPQGDQQVVVYCTEKSAAVHALPSQRQMYTQTINESSNVITADIINFGGVKYTPCLVTYTADGFIKVFSLPSLRPMLDMYFTAAANPMLGITMCFSNYGHGLFMANTTEVQKFSVSTEFMRQLPEMSGRVFTEDIPMPEPPKQSFLKGASSLIFGGGPKPLDREELFGESAGKANTGVAKHIPGANMAPLQGNAVGGNSEIAKAKMAVMERGQKLNEIEDQMENMSSEAKEYAKTSRDLKNHYKNKKWYQI